jgi:hypothetical protein
VAGRRRIRFSIAEGDGSISDYRRTLELESGFALRETGSLVHRPLGEQQLTVASGTITPSTTHEQRIASATAVPASIAEPDVVLITGATLWTIGVSGAGEDAAIVSATRCCGPNTRDPAAVSRSADVHRREEVTAFHGWPIRR